MLGSDLPIFGAPMFLISYPELVAAVSNAGGVGCFPAHNYRTGSELEDAFKIIREKTDRVIGVNILMNKSHNPAWKEQLDISLKNGVKLFITSMGSPRSSINEIKSVGGKVFCDVTTLRHANLVAAAGADALIAVSQGAGGHAGTISPFSLIPYLIAETGLPVIAAGSIGTGRQLAAALALGADGAFIGTRFINSVESPAPDAYKQMIIESGPEEIVYSDSITGVPANWLKKSLEKSRTGGEISDGKISGKNEAGQETNGAEFKRWKDIWSAGHGIAQIKDVKPAAAIMKEIVEEYHFTVKKLP